MEGKHPQSSASNSEQNIEELISMLKGNTSLGNTIPSNGPVHSLNTISIQETCKNEENSLREEIPKPKIRKWETVHKQEAKSPKLLTTIISLSMIIALIGQTTHALTTNGPMVCQTTKQATQWKLPDIRCNSRPVKFETVPTAMKIELYTPNVVEYETVAHVCKKARKKVDIYSSLTGAPLPQPVVTEPMPITVKDCMQMQQHRSCDLGILNNESGLWHTGKELSAKWGWPLIDAFRTCYDYTENCYAFDTTITTRFGSDKIQAALEGAQSCSYKHGNCTLTDGSVIIWTPAREQKCKFTFKETLHGKFADNRWTGDQLGLTFPNTSEFEDCGKKLWVSEEGLAMVPFEKPVRYRRTLDGYVRSTQVAAQLTYLDYEISHALTAAIQHMTTTLCKSMNEVRQWAMRALMLDPTAYN
jgi:hypothetical protein